jgi:hypothetical protein
MGRGAVLFLVPLYLSLSSEGLAEAAEIKIKRKTKEKD